MEGKPYGEPRVGVGVDRVIGACRAGRSLHVAMADLCFKVDI